MHKYWVRIIVGIGEFRLSVRDIYVVGDSNRMQPAFKSGINKRWE